MKGRLDDGADFSDESQVGVVPPAWRSQNPTFERSVSTSMQPAFVLYVLMTLASPMLAVVALMLALVHARLQD